MSVAAATDAAKLQERFPLDVLAVKPNRGDTYVVLNRTRIVDAMLFLRDQLGYDYFVECLGVDYSNWSNERDLPQRFEVVYNLFSTTTNSRIFVKIGADDGEAVPTVKDVFLGAEYPEREIQDLFGVVFQGNAELAGQRFLLPDDWIGYPLRKEFPLGGEDIPFDAQTQGPAVEDLQMPHAGESWEGRTGSKEVSGR
jgi:NADH-quinone oxidoreductase subunit C